MARHRRAALAAPFVWSLAGITTIAAIAVLAAAQPPLIPASGARPQIPQDVRDRAQRDGHVRVIVELAPGTSPFVPEGVIGDAAVVIRQRQTIAAAGARLLSKLAPTTHLLVHRYQTVPQIALDLSPSALAALEATVGDAVRVSHDFITRPVQGESVSLIQGDQVWAGGYDGTGGMIAVLDTGVDGAHPFLSGKVIEEACYSSTLAGESQSVCPNGLGVQIGAGAAVPCLLTDCLHGTHVAGIAAGNGTNAGVSFSGVAKGAELMAVQIFSQINNPISCGGPAPCVGAYVSDIVAGLERVYAVAGQHNIAAVNMSLGGGSFAAPCDTDPTKPIIDNLRALGIATAVAAGNNGSTTNLTSPGCVSSAVSVGSTGETDVVSYFSNVAPFLSLFAPGESITSSVPGGGYLALSGTSMATPHVAGSWALLKQAMPGASVSTILNALRQTGLPITDTRPTGSATIPRVRVFQALASLVPVTSPAPAITTLSPADARAMSSAFTMTITGSGFNALSTANWNGAPRSTTVLSTTQIQASILASDLSSAGSAQVTVVTPAPGGGTSSALPFTIDPPPALTVSATSVAAGGSATVTLTNGFGGSLDWLALAATGASSRSYLQYIYVGAGITSRTWTVTMPSSAGTYEFRLFPDNGYTVAATSPTITVNPTPNPVPIATSLAPSSAFAGGPAFTLTVNGSGFVAQSVVLWNGASRPTTFVSASQLQAAIAATDLAAVASVPVTVSTPAPGGGTSGSLPFTIGSGPSLTVSSASALVGGSVTVTLTNGLGGSGDWLALATTSAPNTSYVQYTYVGTGVTNRTWTVTMPSPGTYEFRLFLNGGYTRAATSPPVAVQAGPPGLVSLAPSSASVGGAAFTLTANGSGFTPSSIVRWNGSDRTTTYVSGTQIQAAIPATDLTTAGIAQVSVFVPSAGTTASLPFTVMAAPSLTVSATTVAGGSSVTVTLTNGVGGSLDWLALAATGAPSTSYLQYTYVGAGMTSRTWTVTMPAAAGTYEFRLFLNNGYTIAATSPPVTVSGASSPPVLTVSATTVTHGSGVTVTLTNGFGGSLDWLALAATGSPSTSYLQYTYVGSGITSRTWTVTMPATAGTYEFRLFPNNGYTLAATSPTVTVSP